ncbi:sulfatase-like hydrolase/transferase [Phycisphaeraceae bacterium D3-23]
MMKPTTLLCTFMLSALAVIAIGCATQPDDSAAADPAETDPRPNVLFIMADDMGYECLGANGGTSYDTPRLDALAANGLRFTNAHAQPICTPSRVQLMTGIYNNRNYLRFGQLDPEANTFAHLFRDAGYATVIAGKWQLGGGLGAPDHFGFDEYCLWQLTRAGPGKIAPRYPNPGLEVNGEVVDYTGGTYGPDIVSDYLCGFFERHTDQPFFAYYPMILPHFPFQPTPDSDAWDPTESREYPRREWRDAWFADMVAYTDHVVGKLVDQLDELGLLENTIIVFVGDNGTYFNLTSQLNGRDVVGGKGKTIDTGTHVPLVVHWPAAVEPGRVSESLVDLSDFLPTLADAAGIDVPAGWEVNGISFAEELRGGAPSSRTYIYCWYQRNGVRETASQHVRTAQLKLYADGRLFNTLEDPDETTPIGTATLNAEDRATYAMLSDALGHHTTITEACDPIQNEKRGE